jgi:hypothetical protein
MSQRRAAVQQRGACEEPGGNQRASEHGDSCTEVEVADGCEPGEARDQQSQHGAVEQEADRGESRRSACAVTHPGVGDHQQRGDQRNERCIVRQRSTEHRSRARDEHRKAPRKRQADVETARAKLHPAGRRVDPVRDQQDSGSQQGQGHARRFEGTDGGRGDPNSDAGDDHRPHRAPLVQAAHHGEHRRLDESERRDHHQGQRHSRDGRRELAGGDAPER